MTMLTPSIDDLNKAAQWLAENESPENQEACKRVASWLLKQATKGYVVVPRVPTPEMINQGRHSVAQLSEQRFLSIWQATIAAAPANQ